MKRTKRLVGKLEEKRPLGETWCRWEDIKIGLMGMGDRDTYGFNLLAIQWRVLVNTIENLRVPTTLENFLTSSVIITSINNYSYQGSSWG
jgi:hypothetical protein